MTAPTALADELERRIELARAAIDAFVGHQCSAKSAELLTTQAYTSLYEAHREILAALRKSPPGEAVPVAYFHMNDNIFEHVISECKDDEGVFPLFAAPPQAEHAKEPTHDYSQDGDYACDDRLEEVQPAATPAGAAVTFTLPVLQDGEHYAGPVIADGKLSHHLVLLPGVLEDVAWQDAMEWAARLGGELPSRREQALLFANLSGHFEEEWYWSEETHAAGSDYARGQFFGLGYQDFWRKSGRCHARAVRRLPI